MSRHLSSSARAWALPLCALPALLVRCSGTEADNPVADVVVTACKSEEEYDPAQVGEFLNEVRQTQTASSGPVLKGTDPPGALQHPLSPTAAFPMGLSCIEWQMFDELLAVQIVNFGSACGAEWQGRTRRQGDRVAIELENPRCAVAACGTCLYDTASVIELPSPMDVTLALSFDPDCDGEGVVREWRLPLASQSRGMSCEFAPAPGLGSLSGPAFMRCGEPDDACDAGLTCLDEGEFNSHCLPACSADGDCPLAGGTRCSEGLCRPSAAATGG